MIRRLPAFLPLYVVSFALAADAPPSPVASVPAPTSQPTVEQSEIGDTLILPLPSAPYPHASRAEGFKIGNKVYPREPHYVDSSVALFVPSGYRKGSSVDVLIYLHGHGNNVRKALSEFKLREQIVASGKNVVLVFPQGPRDAGDSGCGKLEDKGGARKLVEDGLRTLHERKWIDTEHIGRVLITGHSGAYRGLSYIVEVGGLDNEITDVGLLDASYGRLDAFVDWVANHPKGSFFTIFTDHLAPENVYLMTHLRERKVPYELTAEQMSTPEQIAAARVMFLHAEKLNHNQTVGWLEKWLRSRSVESVAK